MADLSITAASVVPGADATFESGYAGETITAGMVVYRDAATRKYMKADADSATAAARQGRGIAMASASLNQPLTIQRTGSYTVGATLTAGLAYYLSNTAGGICPVADIGTGEFVNLIGLATSTTVLLLSFVYPNVSN